MPEIFGAALMGGGSGPAFAAIGVIYPAGATCTCSYGGKTITAKDTSGRTLFLVPTAGQWLVKAASQSQEAEDTVSITTQGQVVSVTLAFFTATIETTFPTDCTSVTCKKDAVTLSVPSGSLSSGSYTFTIPEPGEWVLYATNGDKEKSITVDVIEETEYTVGLSFELILYAPGNKSGFSFRATSSQGSLEYKEESLKITGTDNSNDSSVLTSLPIDLTDYSTLYLHVLKAGNYDSSWQNYASMGVAKAASSRPTFAAKVGLPWGKNNKDVTLDISNLSGEYYVGIALNKYSVWEIDSIKLIP